MSKVYTTYERLTSDPQRRKKIEEEEFILKLTEKLCELMEERGITRAQLAKQLGTSRAFISQLLNGSRNMTLRTFFRLSSSLGNEVHFNFRKLKTKENNLRETLFAVTSR